MRRLIQTKHADDGLKPRRKSTAPPLLIVVGLALGLGIGLSAQLLMQVAGTRAPSLNFTTSAVVVDRDDRLLRAFTVVDGRWRLPVEVEEVDPLLVEMLLVFEDRRFFRHPGVDPLALGRALGQALGHGRIVSGGSTLTMQVVRLLGDDSTRTLAGKWRQMAGALALERVAEKEAILRAYLNLAPYGGNLEGVRAASLAWLGKEPSRLTPAEAALLVALPQSPRARRPDLHSDAARRGRDRVLGRAAAREVIDAETLAAALREPLPLRRRAFPMLAPHAARRAVVSRPELPVHRLTIAADLQARLQALAAEHAALLPEGTSVALLVAEHRGGEIRAVVGSADLLDRERRGFIDMTRALRSPGSTLKPLIYGLAFEQGLAHPESLIEDRPSGFGAYAPTNFDRAFQGTVTLRKALQLSLNVPAVTLLDAVGPARLLAHLRRAGAEPRLPDQAPAGLAIGLGGLGLTLRDLVTVYAAIARGGRPVTLRESRDEPVAIPRLQPVLDERACWYLASILSGADGGMRGGGDVALKTGTSFGYRDAWAIGYDGRHVVGVWAGRPDGAPVPGLTGAKSAVPLLRDAFARIGRFVPLPPPPRGVLVTSTAELPPNLMRVGQGAGTTPDGAVEIAFPPDGARVDLGLRDALASGQGAMKLGAELALQVRNGRPPFVWLVNGRPVAREPYARAARWRPDGPGFAEIAVVDAAGAASRVTVFIE